MQGAALPTPAFSLSTAVSAAQSRRIERLRSATHACVKASCSYRSNCSAARVFRCHPEVAAARRLDQIAEARSQPQRRAQDMSACVG